MASLALTNAEIYRDLSMVMGVNRDYTQWDAQTLADARSMIRSGRRKFYAAYEWSFLTHNITISVLAPYETGTITVADGVVTLASGTWPTNAAGQRLAFENAVYEVATRTSNSQIILVDTSVDAAAGTEYSLYSTRYDLPSSFGAFVGPVTIEAVDEIAYGMKETAILPEFEIRKLLSRTAAFADTPLLFSVTRTIADVGIGLQSYKFEMYPLPDQAYTVRGMVRINPEDSTDEADATELVHPSYAELLRLSILSAAEHTYNGSGGINSQTFMQQLPNFIRRDKVAGGARRLMPRKDGTHGVGDPLYQLRIAPVVIE
jgi:hypothetical protein